MTILYNRRALCMGDDVYNGIYRLRMSEDATLGDLVGVLLRGGNGNDWPIPQTSEIGWTVYSNIGRIADVSADKKRVDYHISENAGVSGLGVEWVFGARADETPTASELEGLFVTDEKDGADTQEDQAASEYSEQDLEYAAEFRDGIHREALEIVRKTRPDITEVVDRHPVEDYFQEHWDYPGRWYTMVSIPCGYGSRKVLIDAIVRDTLSERAPEKKQTYTQELRDVAGAEPGRQRLSNQLDGKPDGYEERFVVEADQKSRSFRAVGVDSAGRYILEHYEEYGVGSATGSTGAYYVLTDLEYGRFARLALINGQLNREDYDRLTAAPVKASKQDGQAEDPFYRLLAEYPDLAVDYCIVKQDGRYLGYESHRTALKTAWRTRFAAEEDGEPWQGNPNLAAGKRITVDELFSPDYRDGELNYRKAFLYPPHRNSYSGRDFVRVNAALFPEGTDRLEVYAWTTGWSDYFDDGHEWWGALCLTVYDDSLGRFAVIMASATD